MLRKEYLQTALGQSNERNKRTVKTNYLIINQEPKSKNSISKTEKVFFRSEIQRQMKERSRRAHTGDIIVQIDFYTTMNNPPAVHTLAKNYLDLLHKETPETDKLKNLLYKDDSQIKILIANYHLNHRGNNSSEIRITSYSMSNFIKDVELAYQILNGNLKPNDHNSFQSYDFEEDREEYHRSLSDLKKDLENHINKKDSLNKKLGDTLYETQREYLSRLLQERYIKINEIKPRDLVNIFQREFSTNRKYSGDKFFENIWNITRGYVFYTSDFVGLGGAPMKEGESNIFQENLKKQLTVFKENHPLLFPLYQPISVTILFIPPEKRPLDSDNLARYILPFLTEEFQPPSILENHIYSPPPNSKTQRFPKYGLTGYQLIQIPRQKSDPVNGKIEFSISDGLLFHSNIWNNVDEIIDKWQKKLR